MYSPRPTVCINEVEQPDSIVVNNITIQSGRTGVNEQPRAAYSTISLISKDGLPIEADLNQCVRVNVQDSNGNETGLFRGFITDISNAIIAHGVLGYVVQTTFTAVSALAKLPRFATATDYPKQFDGERIAAIVGNILIAWDEYDAAATWATIDSALTWNTIDPNNFVNNIESGDYELTAYSGGAVAAAALMNQVADSVNGVLYETPDGYVNYQSAFGRLRDVQENGYITLQGADISAQGLAVGTNLGDVVNEIVLSYKNDQTVTASDLVSQEIYGIQSASKGTLLEHEVDAQQLADFYMDSRAASRNTLEQFQMPLHNPDLDDATRDALLGLHCGSPLEILGIPSWLNGGSFTGFVEGLQWQITEDTLILAAQVSDFSLSAIPESWEQVSGLYWNTIDPTLVWAGAQIVS